MKGGLSLRSWWVDDGSLAYHRDAFTRNRSTEAGRTWKSYTDVTHKEYAHLQYRHMHATQKYVSIPKICHLKYPLELEK